MGDYFSFFLFIVGHCDLLIGYSPLLMFLDSKKGPEGPHLDLLRMEF